MNRPPLVLNAGQIEQLQSADALLASEVVGTPGALVLRSLGNDVVIDPKDGFNIELDGAYWPNTISPPGGVLTDESGDGILSWTIPFSTMKTNRVFHVAKTGNDDTGDGSINNPWATIQKALNYIGDSWISSAATVTIQVADGTYQVNTQINVVHPCASRITITGESALTKTIDSGVAVVTTGTAGNYATTFRLTDVANMAVGEYVLISSLSGGTRPESLYGCHKITAINGSDVTVLNRTRSSVGPSGAITGTMTVIKTILQTSGNTCFSITSAALGTLSKMVLAGTSTGVGIRVEKGGALGASSQIGVDGFSIGIYGIQATSMGVIGALVSGSAALGIAGQGVLLILATSAIVSGCAGAAYSMELTYLHSAGAMAVGGGSVGFAIQSASILFGQNCQSLYNASSGFIAVRHGSIGGTGMKSRYNGGHGFYANFGGLLFLQSPAEASHNALSGVALERMSSVELLNLVVNNNGQWGVLGQHNGFAYGSWTVTGAGNGSGLLSPASLTIGNDDFVMS
ncbi:MAG: hypothetical protein ACOY3P_21660 [Planctomycetota bacterium]